MSKFCVLDNFKRLFILVCCVLLVFLCIVNSEFFDYYYMKATGDWILENGMMYKNPFFIEHFDMVVQQWAYCVYLSLIAPFGKFGILGSVLFFLFLYYLSVRLFFKDYKISNFGIFMIFYISVLFSFSYMEKIRPETLTLVLLMLEIFALDKFRRTDNWKVLFLLPITMLFEINFHAFFWIMHYIVILPFLVPFVPKLVENNNYGWIKIKKLIPFVLLQTLMMCVNPYGIRMILYFFNVYLSHAMDYVNVSELEPLIVFSRFGVGFGFVVCLFMYLLIKHKISSVSFWFIIGFSLLSLESLRNIMFLPIACVFLFYEFYRLVIVNIDSQVFQTKLKQFGSISIILIFVGVTGILFVDSMNNIDEFIHGDWVNSYIKQDKDVFDVFEKEVPKDAKVYSYFQNTSYLEYLGYHNLYIDSRLEIFVKRNNHKFDYLKERYDALVSDSNYNSGRSVAEFVDKYKFDYYLCFLPSAGDKFLVSYLSHSDDYTLLYEDGLYYIYKKE